MLKVKNLFLSKKRDLFQGLSFEIPRQEITLLLGKSGSGKSSLLRCLVGLEANYRGEISYEGRSLKSLSAKERVQIIGFVSQSYSLFPHMSALDNCICPLIHFGYSREESKRRVEKLFSSLGIDGLARSFSHELSGGQQQRVAIARALSFDPLFLALDEPTSALDRENGDLLRLVLKEIQKKGTGIIIATHDPVWVSKNSWV